MRMSNYLDVKRKHFRFPAYDDDEGVKRETQNKQTFSKDNDWILTEIKEGVTGKRSEESDQRSLRRDPRGKQSNYGHNSQQEKELQRHLQNLPDYGAKRVKDTFATSSKQDLFGANSQRQIIQKNRNQSPQTESTSVKKEYSGRSYFVPKYIPASIIQDEPKEEISTSELVQGMEKKTESYLLFDTEQAAYQVKTDQEPTVKKFKQPQETGLTRSEYRSLNKQGNDKKRSVMERSLKGLIEDGKHGKGAASYFE